MSISKISNHPKRRNAEIQNRAKFLAELREIGSDEEIAQGVQEVIAHMERMMELTAPVSALFPEQKISYKTATGILFLLGKTEEAAEFASLAISQYDDGPSTAEELQEMIRSEYITDDLIEARVIAGDLYLDSMKKRYTAEELA